MENDSYNANNLNEYHNQIIEKIKNSDFGNLYEKNQRIIQDNLTKYKIIHMEYGKYGKSEVIRYRDGNIYYCKDRDGNNCKFQEIDNFYIIYISINGDCFGNYLSMFDAFNITKNYMGNVLLDWNNELFNEPFNKGLSTISEKILTKTLLKDIISKNIILYFTKINNFPQNCMVDEYYCRPGLDSLHLYRNGAGFFKFKNIIVLQEEYIQAKKEEQKRLEEEEEKEEQKALEEEQKRREEKERKALEEEQKRLALELVRDNFQNEIINKFIKLTNNYLNYNQARSIICMLVYNDNRLFHFQKFFNEDRNTLLALQVLNKFASENKIRVEDSRTIFTEYIFDIANILKIDICHIRFLNKR
jgi:FtsZ-interacting cell division protein YlmF